MSPMDGERGGRLPKNSCSVRKHRPAAFIRSIRGQNPQSPYRRTQSVAVVVGLVGTFGGDSEVVGLFPGELRELHADLVQVQPGNFLVEFFGKAIDGGLVG